MSGDEHSSICFFTAILKIAADENQLDYDQLLKIILKLQEENKVVNINLKVVERVNELLKFQIVMEKREKDRNLWQGEMQKEMGRFQDEYFTEPDNQRKWKRQSRKCVREQRKKNVSSSDGETKREGSSTDFGQRPSTHECLRRKWRKNR